MSKARAKISGRKIRRSVSVKKKVRNKIKESDNFMQSIRKLAQATKQLAVRAVKEYSPVVENIISSGCRDVRYIEQTLDGLLDFCFDPDMLLLYRRLCRYYFGIDPMATASYIYAYRDMWDQESYVDDKTTVDVKKKKLSL